MTQTEAIRELAMCVEELAKLLENRANAADAKTLKKIREEMVKIYANVVEREV